MAVLTLETSRGDILPLEIKELAAARSAPGGLLRVRINGAMLSLQSRAAPRRDSSEVCAGRGVCSPLSCGLIVYMLSRFQRGRVCAFVCPLRNHALCFSRTLSLNCSLFCF